MKFIRDSKNSGEAKKKFTLISRIDEKKIVMVKHVVYKSNNDIHIPRVRINETKPNTFLKKKKREKK